MERYNIKIVEKKWQDIWSKKKTDAVFLDKNKIRYIIDLMITFEPKQEIPILKEFSFFWFFCLSITSFCP